MIETVLSTLSSIIEILTIVCFGHLFLKRRMRSNVVNTTLILFVIIFDCFLDYINISNLLAMIISCAEFFILLYLIYDTSTLYALFFTWIYCVIIMISEMLISCVFTFVFESEYGIVHLEEIAHYVGMFISDLLVFGFLCFTALLAKKKIKSIPKRYFIMILIYPLLCVCVIYLIDNIMTKAQIINPLFMMIPILCLMYIIFMVFDFFDGYSKKIEFESLNKITEEREANYRILKESNEQIRIMRHDMNKHLKVITDLISKDKTDEARKYIEALNDENKNFSSYIYTNNETFDTAVNIECQRAKASGVDFKSFVGVNGEIKMNDTDITKLFCNLLDNAVEAAEKTKEKFVSIYVTQKGGDLVVSVKNSSGEVDVSDLKTSKSAEDNSGYGLKSIDTVLEKYGSSIYQSYQGGVFETDIVLKNCCE